MDKPKYSSSKFRSNSLLKREDVHIWRVMWNDKLNVLIALIWWNEITINIRGMRRSPIESWQKLKR
ncbi:hypothetical protein CR513_17036, partial [Mucuna pruriens]